jgi:hypothetical protein
MQTSLSAAALASRRIDAPRPATGPEPDSRTELVMTALPCPYRRDSPLTAAFLIYGSAIRNCPNSRGFSKMQFSNRQLKGRPRIISLASSGKSRRGPSLIMSHPPRGTEFLIATVDISENELSCCKRSPYQNSNSNKNGLLQLASNPTRPSKTPACERAVGKLHPREVISYRVCDRRILQRCGNACQSLTSEEVSYITTKGYQ